MYLYFTRGVQILILGMLLFVIIFNTEEKKTHPLLEKIIIISKDHEDLQIELITTPRHQSVLLEPEGQGWYYHPERDFYIDVSNPIKPLVFYHNHERKLIPIKNSDGKQIIVQGEQIRGPAWALAP